MRFKCARQCRSTVSNQLSTRKIVAREGPVETQEGEEPNNDLDVTVAGPGRHRWSSQQSDSYNQQREVGYHEECSP